jgi:hypothetical protein
MNIANSTNTPLTPSQSVLKSANEQPKLALQLLQKSLEGTMTQSSQTLPSPTSTPTSSQEPPHIDIRI